MPVLRVNKTKDYTVMSNYHLRDRNLSLKAKGLLSQMLSLPESWDYTVAGLVAINKEKESSINSALTELKERGYLAVTKLLPNETQSGRIEYIYNVYEQPQAKQAEENPGKYNDAFNSNESSHDRSNTRKRFIPPTSSEVQAYCQERNNNVDANRFIDYYSSNGWKVGKNSMKDWKAAIRTWERNSYSKPASRIPVPEYIQNDAQAGKTVSAEKLAQIRANLKT